LLIITLQHFRHLLLIEQWWTTAPPLNAEVISVAPDDFVSESDIAKRLEVKRQTISLWAKGERRVNKPFPKPVMRLSGKSPLWRWYDVVKWLYVQKQIRDAQIVEDAKFIENINVALSARDQSIRKYRRQLLKRLR